ncbi:MAG: restriction endonuclease subunit S [Deltaproteobacteria bacterium]|nr:restriction endonuclease subunit S [Deltaproteobacteria bacterium]
MGSEWRKLPFTEAVEVNPKVILIKDQEYPFVDMKAIDPSWQNASESEYRVFKSGGARFMPYDTLMARITPCLENGKIARFVPKVDNDEPAFGSTEFIVIRGRKGVTENKFAYYLIKWQEFRSFAISQMTGSSGRQRVPADSLAGFSVPIPELSEQRVIAHILGSLDDKIELNRRMNETLEAMARAIFKSWFVDFDPVRIRRGDPVWSPTKRADTQVCPYMTPEILNLFPDSFEDSELGEIPKGWRPSTIGSEFNLTMGQSPPGKTYNETGDGLPFFQGRRDFGFRFPTNRVYCTAPKRLADHGDTLVSVRAPVGDINMAMARCCIGRGVAGIRHKSGSRSYTYYAMHTLSDRFARFEAEGTVFGAINKKQFEDLRWLSPIGDLVNEFEKIAFALDERIEKNYNETITLVSLCDTLLPKLISGELRVLDTEKVLEDMKWA